MTITSVELAVQYKGVLTASAAGTGEPAWVGELSDAMTGQVETLEIWLPAGEYTTIGNYNTDTARPQPPKGISADVTVVTYMRATGIGQPVEQRFEPLDGRPSLQSLRTKNAGALDWHQKGNMGQSNTAGRDNLRLKIL